MAITVRELTRLTATTCRCVSTGGASPTIKLTGWPYYDPVTGTATTIGTAIATAGIATIFGTVANEGLYYGRAWSGDEYSAMQAIWLGKSAYRRSDVISNELADILKNNILGISAAWQQFATAAGYTGGTVGVTDIVVGDRRDPKDNGLTLCLINPNEDSSLDQSALGYFVETANRTIRGYLDLPEKNESDSRETERERVRDTLRSAISDILMNEHYETITDDNGWIWQACHPTGSDTGEVLRQKKWFWTFEIYWQATVQAHR